MLAITGERSRRPWVEVVDELSNGCSRDGFSFSTEALCWREFANKTLALLQEMCSRPLDTSVGHACVSILPSSCHNVMMNVCCYFL